MDPKIIVTENITLVSLHDVSAGMSHIAGIFEKIADMGVDVNIISIPPIQSDLTSLTFTINDEDTVKLLQFVKSFSGDVKPVVSSGNYIISVIDENMENHPGFASKIFRALAESDVDVCTIATSEIQISMLVTEADFNSAYESITNCLNNI